jgi:SanA protein
VFTDIGRLSVAVFTLGFVRGAQDDEEPAGASFGVAKDADGRTVVTSEACRFAGVVIVCATFVAGYVLLATRAGIVKKLLVTGDDGERSYDEVSPVLTYLLEKGIPGRDIFLDHAGFDTYSSMYRARHIFGARSLVIVTQDFHLPRAVFLARAMGIDADGLVAGDGGTAWDYLREIPATLKAVADLAFHRQSKYLGAPMPLVGKGNAIR